jgi:hypothetical protein
VVHIAAAEALTMAYVANFTKVDMERALSHSIKEREMARRGRRSGPKTCSARVIAFETGRGRLVTFVGRSGGQKRNGGICENKGSVGRERTVNARFARVARRCRGGSRSKRNACVRAGMRRG